jgi:PAS domain-containing protein
MRAMGSSGDVVEAGILGIFIANVEDAIIEANQAFLRMLQYRISRRVKNARPKQQIVIYAHCGPWWVQPWQPYLGS